MKIRFLQGPSSGYWVAILPDGTVREGYNNNEDGGTFVRACHQRGEDLSGPQIAARLRSMGGACDMGVAEQFASF